MDNFVSHLGTPINNFAPMRNCHVGARYVKLVAGVIIMAFYHRIKTIFLQRAITQIKLKFWNQFCLSVIDNI